MWDQLEEYNPDEKIKFKANSVDSLLQKLKKLSCIASLLSDERNDFGFRALMKDFRSCLFYEILDQCY
jgi:hypothetical protein